jgi:hypothetical protein
VDEGRTYTVDGRTVRVREEQGEWCVRCADREARHRFLDRALAQALSVNSLRATELAAAILQRPDGGSL